MKRLFILCAFIIMTKVTWSQSINGGFYVSNDTIPTSSQKQITKQLKIIIDKDSTDTLTNLKVTISFLASKSDVQPVNVYLSQQTYSIKDLKSDITINVPVQILRDSAFQRSAYFKMAITNSSGGNVSLTSPNNDTMDIFLMPYNSGLKTNSNFEALIFAGTNFDLLDGVQAKDLYVKINFFWKLSTYDYLQFGLVKDRLFSPTDSIANVPLFSGFRTRKNLTDTTISLVSGFYSKKITYTNEPLTVYFEYHRKLGNLIDNASAFVSGGLEVGLFKTTINNTMSNLIADTTVVKLQPQQKFAFSPFASQITYTRPNFLYYTGFMFVYDNDNINTKLQLMGGMNYNYRVLSATASVSVFRAQWDPYYQIKINTVIKNPTIGLGIEVLDRRNTPPFFVLTLSKVFDLKDIKSLFSPVSTLSAKN